MNDIVATGPVRIMVPVVTTGVLLFVNLFIYNLYFNFTPIMHQAVDVLSVDVLAVDVLDVDLCMRLMSLTT